MTNKYTIYEVEQTLQTKMKRIKIEFFESIFAFPWVESSKRVAIHNFFLNAYFVIVHQMLLHAAHIYWKHHQRKEQVYEHTVFNIKRSNKYEVYIK